MDEAWRVDWANECVWHGGAMVRLPPKVFAVLRVLVAQAGQLVTKETLLETAWPEAAVSDAVLTSCIGELRKVLGETAQAPRFIQTVHRRGYRFIGQLPAVAPSALPSSPPFPPGASGPPPLLVGRERELTHLHQWLERVRQGARQTVFLTGEPGLGKTTVVNVFVEDAAGVGDVWLARGQCLQHYGVGEPYLPVLEALGRLCRGPEGAALLPVLEQQAPTWLAQMPALLSAATLEAVQRRVVGATQPRMLRELAEAVEVLTVARPLLLVLEDLHWGDHATLELLTYLARRVGPSRLLILGTYRPVEALLRGHPLRTLKQELVLHDQAVELPLELLTAGEVAQYLSLRCAGGADLPPPIGRLAQIMCQRTDGHPLFMVTIVEHLLQCGVLRDGAGQWEVEPEAAAAVLEVPPSVRQMTEQQFDRLSPAEQRVLEAASVAGHAWAVAAVAAALDLAMDVVEDCCAGLVRRGQFLVASGMETWPDGTVTERYDWRHALYQEAVYMRVPEGRRLRLHRRIGTREETGYGSHAGEHAAELAVHFERGQDYQRAVQYLQQAATNALRRFAYQEVVSHLRHGLELLASLPETPARLHQELGLQVALGAALMATQGYASPDVERTHARARDLCQQLGDASHVFQALRGLSLHYLTRGLLHTASDLGLLLLRQAQTQADPAPRLLAHHQMGMVLGFRGEPAQARTHHTEALALYGSQQHHALAGSYGVDLGVLSHCWLAWELWLLGFPDQAVQQGRVARTLATEAAHPWCLWMTLFWSAALHQWRRETPVVSELITAAMALATEQGFTLWLAWGMLLQGWTLVLQGQREHGLATIRQGLAAELATGSRLWQPYGLGLLAEAYGHGGHPEEGLATLAEARSVLEATEVRFYAAELHRLQGALLLRRAVPDAAQAEESFQQALAVSRRQQAKSWELRAAMSLGRLWQQQGKRGEARHLLAEVYGGFTEGFDTVDLQEAHALLTQWAE